MLERHVVLFDQVSTYRREVLEAVAGLSDDEAEVIPRGFRNNVRWNLGHLELDQADWLAALTREPSDVPEIHRRWFGYGTDPSAFDEATPRLDELRRRLAEQPERIRRRYGDRMDERFPPTDMGMHTIEQVLVRTVFHEGLHLATILDILRFVDRRRGGTATTPTD